MSEVEKTDVVVAGEGDKNAPEDTAPATQKEIPEEQNVEQAVAGAEQNGSSHTEKNGSVETVKKAGHKSKPFQSNIRSNYEDLPETSDPTEILRQVNFYFSDANLPQDEYLFSQVGGSKNIPFSLKELHTFKRMKRFQPYSAVIEAVKQSNFLDINENEEVSRKVPLSDDYGDDISENRRIYGEKSEPRTIYAKGFGKETTTTQTQVEEFFAAYGEVTAVRLRRHTDKTFKGTATIEFVDEETATKFLALENKPLWQGNVKLELRSKKDWATEKRAQGERRDKGDRHRPGSNQRSNGSRSAHGGRGDKFQGRGRGSSHRGSSRGNNRGNNRGGRRDGREATSNDDENRQDAKADAEDDADDVVSALANGKRPREEEPQPEAKKMKITV